MGIELHLYVAMPTTTNNMHRKALPNSTYAAIRMDFSWPTR